MRVDDRDLPSRGGRIVREQATDDIPSGGSAG
jgi:hypothetical protein